ncbi:MAG TPA: class I SAM-dependent methyltransferase, partial [Saprospiraceae bacterium]|nr:class I SAM-dependent methyltransferase [Saprospiraceae bacterium]
MSTPQQVTPYENDKVAKKGQVTSMFDKIAPYYDQLNRFLSLGIDVLWRKKTINLLSEYQPQTILDIATGTGDLAIEAATRIHPKKITGLDISANMLKIGEQKIAKKGLQDIIS